VVEYLRVFRHVGFFRFLIGRCAMHSIAPKFGISKRVSSLNEAPGPNSSDGIELHITLELLSQAQGYLSRSKNDALAAQSLKDAWREFYDLCTAKICSFSRHCGMRDKDIDDCCQDVWAELLARLPTFRLDVARGQFETWLFRIVEGKAVNIRRSRKRGLLQESADALLGLPDNRGAVDDRSSDIEMAKLMWDLLRIRLSERNLQVVQLRLVEQCSGAEVAARLGLTLSHLLKCLPLFSLK